MSLAPARSAATDVVLVSSKGDRDPEGNLRCAAPARYRTPAQHRSSAGAGRRAARRRERARSSRPAAGTTRAGTPWCAAPAARVVDEHGREVAYAPTATAARRTRSAGRREVARELARRPWDAIGGPVGNGPRPAHAASAAARSRTPRCCRARRDACWARPRGTASARWSSSSPRARSPPRSGRAAAPRATAATGTCSRASRPTTPRWRWRWRARSWTAGGYDPGRGARGLPRRGSRRRPFDMGHTTAAALARTARCSDSQANGSLMRASPLGIFAHAPARRTRPRRWRARTARSPIRTASAGTRWRRSWSPWRTRSAPATGREAAYEAALSWAREAEAVPAVADALDPARRRAAPDVRRRAHGLGAASPCRTPSTSCSTRRRSRRASSPTVRRGGDTDTNAAIAGALLGAVHGRDAVPAQWRQMVLSCRPVAGSRGTRGRWRYWPVDVYELAERLLLAGERRAARVLSPGGRTREAVAAVALAQAIAVRHPGEDAQRAQRRRVLVADGDGSAGRRAASNARPSPDPRPGCPIPCPGTSPRRLERDGSAARRPRAPPPCPPAGAAAGAPPLPRPVRVARRRRPRDGRAPPATFFVRSAVPRFDARRRDVAAGRSGTPTPRSIPSAVRLPGARRRRRARRRT